MYKCDFAENVECEKKKCSTCGWNPEVAQKRLEAIIAKMTGEKKE
jgi:hypothetical protein